jgi:hypothetical protein
MSVDPFLRYIWITYMRFSSPSQTNGNFGEKNRPSINVTVTANPEKAFPYAKTCGLNHQASKSANPFNLYDGKKI